MSEHLTRKEMKRDEVREFLARVVFFLTENWKQLAWVGAGIVVLLALGGAWLAWSVSQETAAQEELAAAMKIATAEIDPITPDPDATRPVYATQTERDEAARTGLQSLVDDRSSSDAASVARGLLAEMSAQSGAVPEAREIWQQLVDDSGDTALGVAAQLNLFELERQDGRLEELAGELEARLESDDRTLSEDMLLFELARTQEELGHEDDAHATYQRLVDDHAESPFGIEAQRKLSTLG